MGKVDHVQSDVVLFEEFAELLALFRGFGDRVADEGHDALALGFVLSVLQSELADFQSGK